MNEDQRVAYLEARVGELASTIGDLRAEICCLTPEGAEQVAAQPKWTLPLCGVHPDRGGNDG